LQYLQKNPVGIMKITPFQTFDQLSFTRYLQPSNYTPKDLDKDQSD
jgi:hypothetical protein